MNPKIREDVWALYHRGKYDTAVFEAIKAVEVRVREVAGFTNADHGKDMIARAFNAKTGPLRDDSAEPSEREAMAALMTGAYGLYRNSYAHRNVDHNDADAAFADGGEQLLEDGAGDARTERAVCASNVARGIVMTRYDRWPRKDASLLPIVVKTKSTAAAFVS